MAIDERKEVPARRDDWNTFWDDPLGAWRRGDTPLRRFARDMDRWFRDPGSSRGSGAGGWMPDIETLQRGDEFIVRADLPGLRKEDVHVHVTDQTITIEGERRHDTEDHRDGIYRTERTYGAFRRVIPLPAGAIGDSAKATYQHGVLEISMHVPPKEVSRGRRLEISDGTAPSAPPAAETNGRDIYPE
jgi:HSP20 family protein